MCDNGSNLRLGRRSGGGGLTGSRQGGPLQLSHTGVVGWGFVVETKQVERAVHDQERQFVAQGDAAFARAAGSDGEGDDQRTQLGDAVGTGQTGDIGVEGQHIGGVIFAAVASVESVDSAGVGDADLDGAGPSETSGGQRLAHAEIEAALIDTVEKRWIDGDVDAVSSGGGRELMRGHALR